MLKQYIRVIFLFQILCISVYALELKNVRLLNSPDIFKDKIIFEFAGDLWKVSLDGGAAARLTDQTGDKSSCYFSPDGKWIAFTGQQYGSRDVFIMPASGGTSIRLTYHPSSDNVIGWTRDSRYVLFGSDRENYVQYISLSKIYKVSIDGGFPQHLLLCPAFQASLSDDGSKIAYVPLSPGILNTWKMYRGGGCPYINILNVSNNIEKRIPLDNCNCISPRWTGDSIYFLSDKNGAMNIYSYNPENGKIGSITNSKDSDIKSFGIHNGNIVYERDGYLYHLDLNTRKERKIDVSVDIDESIFKEKEISAEYSVSEADISPDGDSILLNLRGEIIMMNLLSGNYYNITNSPGDLERMPVWSPDGKSIAFFIDRDNESLLAIYDVSTKKLRQSIKLQNPRYCFNLIWSPDSDKLAFSDQSQSFYYVDLKKSKVVAIDMDPEFLNIPKPAWSPDSSWIAYEKAGSNHMRTIHIYSTKENKKWQITDEMCDSFNPVFDRSGEYLYFIGSTDKAFDISWDDLSSKLYKHTTNLYAILLNKDSVNPLAPRIIEANPEGRGDSPETVNANRNKMNKFTIDIEGTRERIIPLNIPTKNYYLLKSSIKGGFYYLEITDKEYICNLHFYNIETRKDNVILNNVILADDGYIISRDEKKILYRESMWNWSIAGIDTNGSYKSDKLDISKVKMKIRPVEEWRAVFNQAWRFLNYWFFDPDMKGFDWVSIRNKYEEYLASVIRREDLNKVLNSMLSELRISHATALGGGSMERYARANVGLLGADFELVDGYYRLKKIYRGDIWNPSIKSPLGIPGIDVEERDYILEVDNESITSSKNIYSLLENKAGKPITITVSKSPDQANARKVVVTPISNENTLRNSEWIEANRKKVERLSNGRAGYVYLPSTTPFSGIGFLKRYYFTQLDKEALIVDARFNFGGYPPDLMIDILDRDLLSRWVPRYGNPYSTPKAAHFGPKAMLINEYAMSGGDALAYYFKKAGIGPLIGKRTKGALVANAGYPPLFEPPILMDGGIITVPGVAVVDEDGNYIIENEGVSPDIDVDISYEDYIKERDPQLEKAVEILLKALDNSRMKQFKSKMHPKK